MSTRLELTAAKSTVHAGRFAESADRQSGGKSDRTRLRLVAAVRDEYAATGDITADLVARRAGSSPATFYNYFESKQVALNQAFAATMSDLVDLVAGQLQIERVLDVGLDRFAAEWVLACVEFFRENSMVFSAAQMQLRRSAKLREIYRDSEDAAFEKYDRFVRLGQAARTVRTGDASAIATAMMIESQGYNNPAVLRMNTDDTIHIELTRTVVKMLEPEREKADNQ